MSEIEAHGDPLYLFLCHLEWRRTRNVAACQEVLAALESSNPDICTVAEVLLQNDSPGSPQAVNAEARRSGEAVDQNKDCSK